MSSNLGDVRWMGIVFPGSGTGPLPSIVSPSTLKMRPRPCSPTGTAMGRPVSSASMPRIRPSVDDMATQRTTLSPMWSAASMVTLMPRAGSSMRIALRMEGSLSDGNCTSTAGPRTCTIVPFVMEFSGFLVQCLGAAHDLRDLLRDRSLAEPIPLEDEHVDQLARVLPGRAHGQHARRVLRGERLGERLQHAR